MFFSTVFFFNLKEYFEILGNKLIFFLEMTDATFGICTVNMKLQQAAS